MNIQYLLDFGPVACPPDVEAVRIRALNVCQHVFTRVSRDFNSDTAGLGCLRVSPRLIPGTWHLRLDMGNNPAVINDNRNPPYGWVANADDAFTPLSALHAGPLFRFLWTLACLNPGCGIAKGELLLLTSSISSHLPLSVVRCDQHTRLLGRLAPPLSRIFAHLFAVQACLPMDALPRQGMIHPTDALFRGELPFFPHRAHARAWAPLN